MFADIHFGSNELRTIENSILFLAAQIDDVQVANVKPRQQERVPAMNDCAAPLSFCR